jgi:hypothetical protein
MDDEKTDLLEELFDDYARGASPSARRCFERMTVEELEAVVELCRAVDEAAFTRGAARASRPG